MFNCYLAGPPVGSAILAAITLPYDLWAGRLASAGRVGYKRASCRWLVRRYGASLSSCRRAALAARLPVRR